MADCHSFSLALYCSVTKGWVVEGLPYRYSTPHRLHFFLDKVANKLRCPELDFIPLKYQPGQFSEMLVHLCAKKAKMKLHKAAKAKLAAKS